MGRVVHLFLHDWPRPVAAVVTDVAENASLFEVAPLWPGETRISRTDRVTLSVVPGPRNRVEFGDDSVWWDWPARV